MSQKEKCFGKPRKKPLGRRVEVSSDATPVTTSKDSWQSWLAFVSLQCRKSEIDALNAKFVSPKGDPRPYLRVKIFGVSLLGLLDSGAAVTVIGDPGWLKLRSLGLTLHPHQPVCVADGSVLAVSGSVDLPIEVSGRVRVTRVVVVPSVTSEILLGVDLWKDLDLVPRLRHSTYSFGNSLDALCEVSQPITPDQRAQVDRLVTKYCARTDSGLGRATAVEHIIDVGDSKPIKQRYYPVSPYVQKLIDDEVEKMLALGVIEPSRSAWSSPVVMVKKPNGAYRFCIDFRKINQVSKRDAYPLPYVNSILTRLHNARYFSSIDVKSAYWQIPLSEASKEITAFTVPGKGLFQFTRMPFGLHNAPATWQRFVDTVIGADLEPLVFVYLDDVIVATPDFHQHLDVLEKVLTRLTNAGLTMNREKCEFLKDELRYLGHIVDSRGVRTDPSKIECMLNYPRPTSVKELRRFVGLISWYRKFVRNFSTIVSPLTRLTRKNQRFCWSPEAEQAFLDIKNCLVTAPILASPDFSLPFVLQCDASQVGLGCVLAQTFPDGEKVIAYASRALSPLECKYSATELECLAVLYGIEKFRPYLEGIKFTVVTDHSSLLWLHKLQNPSGRLARWSLRLQGYSFDIVHRKGASNVVPDALSRAISAVDVPRQVTDQWYNSLRDGIMDHPHKYPRFCVRDWKIFYLPRSGVPSGHPDEDWKLVIPKELRQAALQENHDAATAGHFGYFKTQKRVTSLYYWPKMNADIARYIKKCDVCASQKPEQRPPHGRMGRRVVTKPWELVCTDLMGPFPLSKKGHRFILVVADCFTKFVFIVPLRSATSSALQENVERIFLTVGTPALMICDNGKQYVGKAFRKLVESYDCEITFNPNYHPQANPTERINRVVKTAIRSYLDNHSHRDWDLNLHKIAFAINTAVHEVTGFSPAYLTFGRTLYASGKLHKRLQPISVDAEISFGSRDALNEHLQDLANVYDRVKKSLDQAYVTSAKRYNLRTRPLTLREGQVVWKKNYVLSKGGEHFAAGLAPKFVKCIVRRQITPNVYELEDFVSRNTLGSWHVKDLKVANEPDQTA
jgi:transposase InsO family protein